MSSVCSCCPLGNTSSRAIEVGCSRTALSCGQSFCSPTNRLHSILFELMDSRLHRSSDGRSLEVLGISQVHTKWLDQAMHMLQDEAVHQKAIVQQLFPQVHKLMVLRPYSFGAIDGFTDLQIFAHQIFDELCHRFSALEVLEFCLLENVCNFADAVKRY